MEHVSNPEALAIAALIFECDRDLLWSIYLAHALFFEWDEWEGRDPTHKPKQDLSRFQVTAADQAASVSTTARTVRKALGKLTPAEVLPLDGRHLTDNGILWLSEALVIRRDLNIVDLSFNQLSPTAVEYLCECFVSSSLEALYLGNNVLGDVGAAAVAKLLMLNPQIKRLNLSRNGLTNKGVLEIARAIAATGGVETISFTNNQDVTDEGVDQFKAVIEATGRSLPVVDFRGCAVKALVSTTSVLEHGLTVEHVSPLRWETDDEED